MGKRKQERKEAKKAAHRKETMRAFAMSALVGETASPNRVASPASEARSAASGLFGGRVTADQNSASLFGGFNVIVPPPDAEMSWRRLALDANALDRLPVNRLIDMICDISPDISKARWDYQRLINPGFEMHAYKPGTTSSDKNDIDPKGEKALQAFLKVLQGYYGTFDIPINRLSTSIFTRGALLAELVLDKAGKMPVDFVTPDPVIVRFQRRPDEARGYYYQAGQYIRGQFIDYARPTIQYIPIDPAPDVPYGRALISPALFSAMFLLGLLHDLRRVISQQGYPRIDITVNLQKIREMMPDESQGDTVEFAAWVKQAISEVKTIYARLQPEDAYVHNDAITITAPVGTINAQGLGVIGEIIKVIERMSVRALKSMPLLMGTTDGVSEANANRQWEIFAAGIKSIQHYIETLIETLFTLMLEAQGIPAVVRFKLAEIRAAELQRDAQVERLQISNEQSKYEMGYTTLDEGAHRLTGHDAVETEPRGPIGLDATPLPTDGAVADPGSNRTIIRIRTKKGVIRLQGTREAETVTPAGADAGLTPVPGVVEVSDAEFSRYIREWERAGADKYEGLLDCDVVDAA